MTTETITGFKCDICETLYPYLDQAEKCEIGHANATLADLVAEGQKAEQPEIPQPLAAELLGRAARHMHDRASTYDKPDGERSMGRTIAAFNAVTGRDLSESEGWLFMSLLKAVRSQSRAEPHTDSIDDFIAYAALYGESRGSGR